MSDTKLTQPQITVYSTNWCGFCRMAKQYLDSKGASYQEKNIEEDKQAYDELMGKINGNFMGVPVIDIKGDIILGFDRPKIDEALSK